MNDELFCLESREQTAVDTGLIIPPRTWDKATLLHLSIPPQTRDRASWQPNQASSAVLGASFVPFGQLLRSPRVPTRSSAF